MPVHWQKYQGFHRMIEEWFITLINSGNFYRPVKSVQLPDFLWPCTCRPLEKFYNVIFRSKTIFKGRKIATFTITMQPCLKVPLMLSRKTNTLHIQVPGRASPWMESTWQTASYIENLLMKKSWEYHEWKAVQDKRKSQDVVAYLAWFFRLPSDRNNTAPGADFLRVKVPRDFCELTDLIEQSNSHQYSRVLTLSLPSCRPRSSCGKRSWTASTRSSFSACSRSPSRSLAI